MHFLQTDGDDRKRAEGPPSRENAPTAAPHDRSVRVGARVRVRRQRWSVVDTRSYDGCQLLMLHGIGPANAGCVRHVIAPFERIEPLDRQPRLRIVGGRRWRRQCRALLAGVRPPGGLATALHAQIDLLPHQLEPALAILHGVGTRVLIADDVGLGKTIQAGLIATELVSLGAADRILVLTPAGLRDQWAAELRDRFGLDPAIVDMCDAKRRAARLPIGMNPWATLPVAITSIDYAKRPEVLPAIQSCRWDVVIVDEAHGVTRGSDRHEAVSALCEQAPYVVLLTATPHNGDRAAFESLCLLGADRAQSTDRLLVFRRTRRDVALGAGRRVHCLRVRSTAEEISMHERLARFTNAIRAERQDQKAWLALATLHKRAMSSAHSLRTSVMRRLSGLSPLAADGHRQLALPLDDGGGELDSSDEAPVWTSPGLDDVDQERRLLDGVAEAARAASVDETKLTTLARLLARLEKRREAAIVFTEYRDTLSHVLRVLQRACAVLHGGLTREERQRALDDFRSGRQTILLATDAGGEGLNLHQTCRVVINLELPWNPMRLEQRIGRVDRIGQRRTVHAFNLIARDTGEARIFDRLKARIALARQDIGTTDPLASAQGEEDASFRVVVCEAEDVVGTEPWGHPRDNHEPLEESRRLVSLSAEADAEYARLLWARTLLAETRGAQLPATLGGSNPVMSVDSLVAFARHPVTRRRLAPRILVLLLSTIEDRGGRVMASHVTPLTVQSAVRVPHTNARSVVCEILRSLELRLQSWQAPAGVDAAPDIHRAFWIARLARERAISARSLDPRGEAFQTGLFDRRREHEAEVRAAVHHENARRLAALEGAAVLGATETRAALILVP